MIGRPCASEPQERLAIVVDALLIGAGETMQQVRAAARSSCLVANSAVIWYGTMSPTQPMICAWPCAASGRAIEAMAIVASTWPLCTAASMFGTCCTGRSVTLLASKPSVSAIRPSM